MMKQYENDTDPAAQRAFHQEVFVFGVELRLPSRLEVRLQKPLAQRGHYEPHRT